MPSTTSESGAGLSAAQRALADALDAALPQTQCTRCGEPDCRRYAEAIAASRAPINRCPPGGAEGIARLAALTGQPALPLDPEHGIEGPRRLAVIDEAVCIGCMLCIKACPVDCIVGAAKHMHTVIESQCTGCELCLPACPVDCIGLVDAEPLAPEGVAATGWGAWSIAEAAAARQRYAAREARRAAPRTLSTTTAHRAPESQPSDPAPADRKRAAVAEALRKARLRRSA